MGKKRRNYTPRVEIEVGGLETRMVAAQRAHAAGPRPLDHQVPGAKQG